MTSKQLLQSTFLDILFDGRNKDYGAYVLRKTYSSRLTLSLIVTISTAFGLCYAILQSSSPGIQLPQHADDLPEMIVETYHLPPDQPQQIIPARRSAHSIQPSIDYTAISSDRHETVTIDAISTNDNTGVLPGGLDTPYEPQQGNPGVESTTEAVTTSTFTPVEMLPSFPGGQEAWMLFLRKNLSTPSELEAGERRTVIIRFVVGKDGAITVFDVIQSAGSNFDKEVIRVLKKMPKWNPAIQNGHPVTTTFTQAVTFEGLAD